LRQPEEVRAKSVASINVNPVIGHGLDDASDSATQTTRIEFEMDLALQSTQPWVKVPQLLVLMNHGRSFKIEIEPNDLPPGVHVAHVEGYDVHRRDRGPMFRLLVTLVKPLEPHAQHDLGHLIVRTIFHVACFFVFTLFKNNCTHSNYPFLQNLQFEPAEVKRFFFNVPTGATWMDVTVRDTRTSDLDVSSRTIVLHALQLLPHTPYRDNERKRVLNLVPGQTLITSTAVHEGVTLELALARQWSVLGDTSLHVQVSFQGITPSNHQLTILPGGAGASTRITSALSNESILPTAKLTHWRTPIRPKSPGTISPLGERDLWPTQSTQIHQLVLTYEFDQPEAGNFIPRVPSLQGYLYESPYESQMILAFDSQKKLLGVADSWPSKEISGPKGKITLRMQIRHDSPEMLLKLSNQVLWIERKLSKEVAVSVFASHHDMLKGQPSFSKRTLAKGNSCAIFLAEPAADKLPKATKAGDVLLGNVSYESPEGSLPGAGKKPGGFPLQYLVGPSESTVAKPKDPEPPDDRTPAQKLEDAILKVKLENVQKLASDEKQASNFTALYDSVMAQHPNEIQLMLVGLLHDDLESWRMQRLNEIVQKANSIIDKIDASKLVLYYGVTGYYNKDDGPSVKERKEMDQLKDALIEALARKARALADLDKPEFDDTMQQLAKWVDNMETNNKFAVLNLAKLGRQRRLGSVLKLLTTLLEKDGEETKGGICPLTRADLLKRRATVLEELGYHHLVEYDRVWSLIASPKSYTLF